MENKDNPKNNFAGKHIHFIGIGGCGMRALASALLKFGAKVTGSDAVDSAHLKALIQQGADCWVGHNAEKLPDNLDYAVISAAIDQTNPELVKLKNKNCKILKYAQMLGLLMDTCDGIAISGTHGKTTTTAMIAYILKEAQLDPSFVVGASRYFIAEACEYDRSFLNLYPQIGVILNIEEDHLDYYKDIDEIIEAFAKFASQIRSNGKLIVNGEDSNVAKCLNSSVRIETFGLNENCDWRAENIDLTDGVYEFDVYYNDKFLGRAALQIPGRHNIYNALPAIACSYSAGVEPEKIFSALKRFQGAFRRLTLKGSAAQITVLDDYAHHPTEIQASLLAARERYNPQRLWCIFQPHQHSRTRFLLDDFAKSFSSADIVVVPDIYFVRDSQTERQLINSGDLVAKISQQGGTACYLPRFDQILQYLKSQIEPGDLVITMGAGDIWKVADELIHWLGRDSN